MSAKYGNPRLVVYLYAYYHVDYNYLCLAKLQGQ